MKRSLLIGFLALTLAGCGVGSNGSSDAKKMTWREPVMFSALHNGFQNARLVIDQNDRAMLAWTTDSHVWASTSEDHESWSNPVQVDDAVDRAGLASLAMNPSGKAALMWKSEESTPADYFKVRMYSPLTGWADSAQLIDSLTSDGSGGAIDINDTGDVMAISSRYSASGHVWALSYTTASGWSDPATRLDTTSTYVNFPDVAIDNDGNATVVWEQWDGTRNQAIARSYTNGVGWDENVTELDGSGDPGIDRIRLAADEDGNGLAYWTLADRTGIKTRRLVNGVWQSTEDVVIGTNIYTSEAKIAHDGRIVQTWTNSHNVYARTCAGGIWNDDETLISDDGETLALRTAVTAMNEATGKVIVLWTRLAEDDADGSAVWARRYDPAKGWSPVEEVLPWTPGILYDVDDAVLLDDGRVLAVLAGEDVSVWEYTTFLISYY